ncbi:MAG: ADP-ribosylation factor-like protein, partial [Candidatus Heimdallarchaeota archaeon]
MFLRRLLRKKSLKTVQIAFVGLEAAGKTTCVNRLMKRNVEQTFRTLGLSTDHVKYRNLEFRIFDLGGQKTFRDTIWDSYVSFVDAIVFVLDSADHRIDEAAQALWHVLEVNQETPVLFLANKDDLPYARAFDEIIDDLDLSRASRSSRPFGLFRISALTGSDFYDAFDWLADTLQAETVFTSCSIFAAVLVKIASGEFNLARFKSIQAKIIDQFMADLDVIAENMGAYNSGMEVSLHEKLQLVCVKRNKLVCALVQGIDDSLTRGRLISERLLKQY